jgi:hypothetical protein
VLTAKGEPRKVTAGLLKVAPDYADHAARLAECCGKLLDDARTAQWVALAAAGLRAGRLMRRPIRRPSGRRGWSISTI